MTFIDFSSPLNEFAGRTGMIEVRRSNGGPVVPPTHPRHSLPLSGDKPLSRRARINAATRYGRRVCADPNLHQVYEEVAGTPLVYTIAFRDYLRPPEITALIDCEYEGRPRDLIRVYARDDTKVAAVSVVIRDSAGEVLERGDAEDKGYYWAYRAARLIPPGKAIVIEATARDLAGNKAVRRKEVLL